MIRRKMLLLLLSVAAISGKAQIITTVAGIPNVAGYSGDNGLAIQATLNGPIYMVFDKKGNLYFSEKENHVVRKVSPEGIITTIAGKGVAGYSGDGGAATLALLNWPVGVAVDSLGNVFIADGENFRIRKVDTSGIITTICGTGILGYSPDGVQASSANLGYVNGLVFDSRWNLILCDIVPGAHRVRQISKQGIITTLAGMITSPGFSGDGGAATAAKLSSPVVCALDADNNIYIVDAGNLRIRKVTRSTGIITTIAGTGASGYSGDDGPATDARFNFPRGIACDKSGNIFVGELAGLIRKVDTLGIITRYCGDSSSFVHSGDGGPPLLARLYSSGGLAFDSSGNLYLTGFYSHTIRRISAPPASVPTSPTAATAKLSVYPNPASEVLHVELKGNSSSAELCIVDVLGRQLTRQSFSGTVSINTSGYTRGAYKVLIFVNGRLTDAVTVVKQ